MSRSRISLVGHRIVVVVSEPWEMVDGSKSNRLWGTIAALRRFSESVDRESILVDLSAPVVWRSTAYPSLLIEARHGEGLIDAMSDRDDVECNFVGITSAQREPLDELDMSKWRGGLAGIAAVRLDGG